jgi:hypothetical protein
MTYASNNWHNLIKYTPSIVEVIQATLNPLSPTGDFKHHIVLTFTHLGADELI